MVGNAFIVLACHLFKVAVGKLKLMYFILKIGVLESLVVVGSESIEIGMRRSSLPQG
jgi:hypothetical protein